MMTIDKKPKASPPPEPLVGEHKPLRGGAAMNAILRVSHWRDGRVADELTDELAQAHEANRKMLGARKKLILPTPKGQEKTSYDRVNSAARELKQRYRWWTIPYPQIKGVRLLPASVYWECTEDIESLIPPFYSAADDFAEDFPKLMKQAIDASGKNGKQILTTADYPSPSQIRSLFDVYFDLQPVCPKFFETPEIGNKLPAERLLEDEINRINANAEATLRRHYEYATREIFVRFKPLVERMIERLENYEEDADGKVVGGKFHDTLVSNIEDVLELVPAFNLTENVEIDEFALEMRQLCVNPDVLRECETTRNETRAYAEEMAKKIEVWLK